MAGPDGSISVVSGDIETQAKNLGDLKNELERTLNSCSAQIRSLEESGAFTGGAGSSFQGKFQEWNTSALKTVGILEEFGQYLGKASAAFQEVDQAYSLKG